MGDDNQGEPDKSPFVPRFGKFLKCRPIRMCGHGAGPMAKNWKPSSPWLRRKAKQGFKGYPIATIAFYGPTDTLATKVVVSIVRDEGHEPDPLERWFSEDTDVRNNPAVGEKVVAFPAHGGCGGRTNAPLLVFAPHRLGSLARRIWPLHSCGYGHLTPLRFPHETDDTGPANAVFLRNVGKRHSC